MRKTFDDGSWFDTDTAASWESWNDSLERNEKLWRTRKGTFVLETDSSFDDRGEMSMMTADEGVIWLIRNDHEVPEDLGDKQADLEI